MPDNSGQHELIDYATVVKDRPDVRDLFYSPTLRPLVRSCNVPDMLLLGLLKVRNQLLTAPDDKYGEGTCTAQALANVVDLLRYDNLAGILEAESKEYDPVSPGMLYDHGKTIETAEAGIGTTEEGLRSLRTAIKGFYHNGVCTDALWQDKLRQDKENEKNLDVKFDKLIDSYKNARETPLGSYYRLHPILNDYHAALNEVGVIYAAAAIHDGWDEESVKSNQGVIKLPDRNPPGLLSGNHAFAIVGYTPEGFLILNSWGDKWGNYDPKLDKADPKASGGIIKSRELPGVALWSYQDWAKRLLEGWVLRLGVSAPEAFRFSFGRQGIDGYLNGEIKAGSTPRHELIGHYIHIDDGKFVADGTMPSRVEWLSATRQCLDNKWKETTEKGAVDQRYTGILLCLAGGSGGMKDVLGHIAKTKDFWKQKKIYPVTAVWCSDLMDRAQSFLEQIEEAAFKIVGAPGLDLDRRIELDVRGIGRAVWRDITRSAEKAAAADTMHDEKKDVDAGAMLQAYDALTQSEKDEIHIVAEGVGAKLLYNLVQNFGTSQYARVTSVTLIMPACTVEEYRQMREWLRPWGKDIHIIVASEATIKRFRFGRYRGSLLDLAQMAFVDVPPKRSVRPRPPKPNPEDPAMPAREQNEPRILKTGKFTNLIGAHSKRRLMSLLKVPERLVREIKMPGGASSFVSLRELLTSEEVRAEVERIIKGDDKIIVTEKAKAPNGGAKVEPMQGDPIVPPGQDGTAIILN